MAIEGEHFVDSRLPGGYERNRVYEAEAAFFLREKKLQPTLVERFIDPANLEKRREAFAKGS